eukprot:TRINITY_DN61864_c0_g1_i1.p1 TRINITY_DN61864_c0_g1~~TRINITY_DN61864_c0_g1_i1.p1  ORF type:complete len:469 (+),score=41.03 TRINITY_DN61864_c0_g1_i1:104-1408(+)
MAPAMQALSNCQSSPKYTFKGRRSEGRKSDTPGPGAYTGQLAQDTVKYGVSPRYGFGCATRDAVRSPTAPGPGQYTPSADMVRSSSLGHSFGSGARKVVSPRGESPGPGAYTASPRVGTEGPKTTMGSRRDVTCSTNSPGPAAYTPADVSAAKMGRMPQHSFSRSPRETARPQTAPGPGQYTPIGTPVVGHAAEYSFGTSVRKEAPSRTEPGPGAYNLSQPLGSDSPKYSAGTRSPRNSQRTGPGTPGPGAYTCDASAVKYTAAAKFTFGTSQKDSFSQLNTPGPGQYNSNGQLNKASPRHSFGTAVRGSSGGPGHRETSPGPGTYTQSGRMGVEGPKFSAGARQNAIKSADTPGPGSYQVADRDNIAKQASPRFGFGTSTRVSTRESNVPGPGTYNDRKDGQGPGYTMGSRIQTATENRTPGPGAHDHCSLWA